MAIYQFVIELIPNAWIKDNNSKAELLYNGDLYDLSDAWKNYQLDVDLKSLLSSILPIGESWSNNLQVWGDDEYSDIHVFSESGDIGSIKFRIDLRSDFDELSCKIIEAAKKLNCYLFFPELKEIVFPDIDSLNNAISRSRAVRFVENPKKFLDELKKEEE